MIDQGTLKSIEDLHRLKNDGIITAEEFERSKQKLLFGGPPAAVAPQQPFFEAAPATRTSRPVAQPRQDDWFGWLVQPLRRYADFQGRSRRREFWMFLLPSFVGFGIIGLLEVTDQPDIFGRTTPAQMLAGVIALLLLGLLVPLIAVEVRRMHDQNRSGWFVALNLIPYIGWMIVWVFMAQPGTVGSNRFGPDPKTQ